MWSWGSASVGVLGPNIGGLPPKGLTDAAPGLCLGALLLACATALLSSILRTTAGSDTLPVADPATSTYLPNRRGWGAVFCIWYSTSVHHPFARPAPHPVVPDRVTHGLRGGELVTDPTVCPGAPASTTPPRPRRIRPPRAGASKRGPGAVWPGAPNVRSFRGAAPRGGVYFATTALSSNLRGVDTSERASLGGVWGCSV